MLIKSLCITAINLHVTSFDSFNTHFTFNHFIKEQSYAYR